ncbi:MAG: T9SS type A sorting domain-containing protein, partial [Bacteroidales bacterium]|nr:T9SS type A sorting domain-containing protein [Bacteroidales bacterium]
TNQPIDFSQYSASLALEVPGYPTFDVPLQGILGGNSSNTILIASDINIPKGVSSMKAYLTAPVDNNPSNDTITLALDISPALSVTINPITQAGSCSKIGSPVYQDIVIRNTGTVDLTGIELMLVINGTYTTEIVKEPVPIDLAVNESRNYLFTTPYIVPDGATYQVRINAYLGCDSAWVNRSDAVEECSDLHNLRIVSIDNPQEGQTNVSGSSHTITVSLENWDDVNSFDNVSIFAVIEDENGQVLTNRWGTIDRIEPSRTQPFTFTEAYTIPDETYIIRVYLANVDVYPEDDTLSVKCYTESVGIETLNGDIFTLNQNIPNPANSSTRIDYSIPEAGEVIFHVHSVSGQLLYSKTIEAANGKQSLELNTSTFAAGIYFYSIEYKGQRLIKRMMINN